MRLISFKGLKMSNCFSTSTSSVRRKTTNAHPCRDLGLGVLAILFIKNTIFACGWETSGGSYASNPTCLFWGKDKIQNRGGEIKQCFVVIPVNCFLMNSFCRAEPEGPVTLTGQSVPDLPKLLPRHVLQSVLPEL